MSYFKYLKIMLLLKQIKTPITDDNNRVVQNMSFKYRLTMLLYSGKFAQSLRSTN